MNYTITRLLTYYGGGGEVPRDGEGKNARDNRCVAGEAVRACVYGRFCNEYPLKAMS